MYRTVIITGANRGLGKAFIDVLIKDEDCFIISMSRSLSDEQKEYSSERFHFLKMDLSKDNVNEKISALKYLFGSEPVL
jgi:benzil reductase ((S)-benzoin forming)